MTSDRHFNGLHSLLNRLEENVTYTNVLQSIIYPNTNTWFLCVRVNIK